MNFLKSHWLRITYSMILIISSYIAYCYSADITSDNIRLNKFSYIGTVATIIALLIAIFEIAQSIHASKSIQKQAKEYLSRAESLDHASFSTECLGNLDEANSYINSENYNTSLKCFQHFRKTFSRFSYVFENIDELNKKIGEIELSLHTATQTTVSAPLTKISRSNIQKDIISIKNILEEIYSKRKDNYVSPKN
jgi:hypothetical protein